MPARSTFTRRVSAKNRTSACRKARSTMNTVVDCRYVRGSERKHGMRTYVVKVRRKYNTRGRR